ncbi:hypothetical protein [Lactiplantibacillus plantarum]|uniref:hypothetical protein n=1 Tax=Lactiplantibacillus plantarum TaxID=1590 RepID=UPI0007B54E93|nr:hypothetical protein [Lactiplantibacillus plantarum]
MDLFIKIFISVFSGTVILVLTTFIRDKITTKRLFINDTRDFSAKFFGDCYKYLFYLRNCDFKNKSKINDYFLDVMNHYPVMLMRLGDRENSYRQKIVFFVNELRELNDAALRNDNCCTDIAKLITELNKNIVPIFERSVYFDWEKTNDIKCVLKHEWNKFWR